MYLYRTSSAAETAAFGEKIGSFLDSGDVVCLYGDLGAGKTIFAQGVARGLGIEDPVTSPTFTLINEYQGRLPFYHMDVFRLCSLWKWRIWVTRNIFMAAVSPWSNGRILCIKYCRKTDLILPLPGAGR